MDAKPNSTRGKPRAERIRLNRYLALLGMGSRRACDELVFSGRVRIAGEREIGPGVKIIPGVSQISVDGLPLERPPKRVVLLLNKPEGVVSTVSDPRGRKTVLDFCKRYHFARHLFPVGRLDMNTTGAILLTNDGLLCYRLTHPRFQIPRIYHARVMGSVAEKKKRRLLKHLLPVNVPDGRAASRPKVVVLRDNQRESVLRIVLCEGRNRQVRRVCAAVGLRVVKLKRVAFGPISVRRLPMGGVRPLTRKELGILEIITSRES